MQLLVGARGYFLPKFFHYLSLSGNAEEEEEEEEEALSLILSPLWMGMVVLQKQGQGCQGQD
jgi:hypothetical protein